MAKIEVRGDSDAGSLYVNGRFIRSFWCKDRADADIIAEKLAQALALSDTKPATAQITVSALSDSNGGYCVYVNGEAVQVFGIKERAERLAELLARALTFPNPSVATAQNSQLPEAKPVDREFLHKYLQTLQSLLVTPAAVEALTQNVLKVDIQAVLDMLRSATGLPTRPLLVPGYVVPASALVSPPAIDIKIVAIRPARWYRITLNGVKVGAFGALDSAQKRVDELRQALGLPLEFPAQGAVAPATIKPDVGISQNGEDMLVNGFAVETYSHTSGSYAFIAYLRQAFDTSSPYIPTIKEVPEIGLCGEVVPGLSAYEVWLNGVFIQRYCKRERAERLKQSLNFAIHLNG